MPQLLSCVLTGEIRERGCSRYGSDLKSVHDSDVEDIEDDELYMKTMVCNDVMLVLVSLLSDYVDIQADMLIETMLGDYFKQRDLYGSAGSKLCFCWFGAIL